MEKSKLSLRGNKEGESPSRNFTFDVLFSGEEKEKKKIFFLGVSTSSKSEQGCMMVISGGFGKKISSRLTARGISIFNQL